VDHRWRGRGLSTESTRPGLNCPTAADRSGDALNTGDALDQLRRQRRVEHLHRLGPRALFEFLGELGQDHLINDAIEHKLARYGHLDLEMLKLTGGDRFPAPPLLLVRR